MTQAHPGTAHGQAPARGDVTQLQVALLPSSMQEDRGAYVEALHRELDPAMAQQQQQTAAVAAPPPRRSHRNEQSAAAAPSAAAVKPKAGAAGDAPLSASPRPSSLPHSLDAPWLQAAVGVHITMLHDPAYPVTVSRCLLLQAAAPCQVDFTSPCTLQAVCMPLLAPPASPATHTCHLASSPQFVPEYKKALVGSVKREHAAASKQLEQEAAALLLRDNGSITAFAAKGLGGALGSRKDSAHASLLVGGLRRCAKDCLAFCKGVGPPVGGGGGLGWKRPDRGRRPPIKR